MDTFQEGFKPSMTSIAQRDAHTLKANRTERINFFCAHKDEKWFKNMYHPDDSVIQKKKRTIALKKRFDIFNEYMANGKIDSISVDANNGGHLICLLDSVIIKLEGSTDFDLTVLSPTETSKIKQEPEHEKKETNKKTNARENSDGVVYSDKKDGDEINKIDKSEVNNTEDVMDFQNLDLFNVWKGRIWFVNGITNHYEVALNDMKLCANIINTFDNRSGLLQTIEGEHPAIEKTYKVVFSNPKEASSGEEKCLGKSVPFECEVNTEIHTQLLKALDKMILYLRIVHSVDFYNYIEYAYEDDMPIGGSVMHVRGPKLRYPPTQQEITGYCDFSQINAKCLIDTTNEASERELNQLGAVDEEKAMDNCIKNCMKRISHGNWQCKMSGKIFKRRRDVRKNIIKNYSGILDNLKKELQCFNNFLRDPNRPKQIPNSYPSTNRYQMSGHAFM